MEHGLHVAQGSWLPGEAAQSSTGREMVVVLRVLDSIAHKLCNMRVLVGSRQPHLQTELLKIDCYIKSYCQTVSSKPVSGGKPGRVVRINGCGQ